MSEQNYRYKLNLSLLRSKKTWRNSSLHRPISGLRRVINDWMNTKLLYSYCIYFPLENIIFQYSPFQIKCETDLSHFIKRAIIFPDVVFSEIFYSICVVHPLERFLRALKVLQGQDWKWYQTMQLSLPIKNMYPTYLLHQLMFENKMTSFL